MRSPRWPANRHPRSSHQPRSPQPWFSTEPRSCSSPGAAGHVVAWAGGHNAPLEGHEQIVERLAAAGGGAIDWEPGEKIKIPGAGQAESVSAPLIAGLGWLASLAQEHDDDGLGTSVRWMGLVAASAVEHVAQGRFVLRVLAPRSRQGSDGKGSPYHVRWNPALTDEAELESLTHERARYRHGRAGQTGPCRVHQGGAR